MVKSMLLYTSAEETDVLMGNITKSFDKYCPHKILVSFKPMLFAVMFCSEVEGISATMQFITAV